MTKLPARNVLDGSKIPKTTTGEMRKALGQLRNYLNDLLGEDSTDIRKRRVWHRELIWPSCPSGSIKNPVRKT